MKQSKFPKGWDEEKIQRVIHYYEEQSDDSAIAEYEKASLSKIRMSRAYNKKTSSSHRESRKVDRTKIRHR